MEGGEDGRLGGIGHELGHLLEKAAEHGGRGVLEAMRGYVGVEAPPESVQVVLVVLQKDGHKVVGQRVLAELATRYVGPVVHAHGAKALTQRPELAQVALKHGHVYLILSAVDDQSIARRLTRQSRRANLRRVGEIGVDGVRVAFVFEYLFDFVRRKVVRKTFDD